jgi:hypothetical protein
VNDRYRENSRRSGVGTLLLVTNVCFPAGYFTPRQSGIGRVQSVSHFTRQRPLKLIPVVQFYMSEVQQLALAGSVFPNIRCRKAAIRDYLLAKSEKLNSNTAC